VEHGGTLRSVVEHSPCVGSFDPFGRGGSKWNEMEHGGTPRCVVEHPPCVGSF